MMAILSVSFHTASAQDECTETVAEIGSHHIKFRQVLYDFPCEGQSTWLYTVYAHGSTINSVTIPLNDECIEPVDAGMWGWYLYSGYGCPSLGTDSYSGEYGIKFNRRIRNCRRKNYYITVNGNLNVEPVDNFTIRSGWCHIDQGTVCGPSYECTDINDEPDPEPLVSCISGLVFHDENLNGIRETEEPMVPGAQVILNLDGTPINGAITEADGAYSFCDLAQGNYTIQIVSPNAQTFATQPNIGDDLTDSDIMGQAGITETLTISEDGQQITNVDGGFSTFGLWDLGFVAAVDNNFDVEKNTLDAEDLPVGLKSPVVSMRMTSEIDEEELDAMNTMSDAEMVDFPEINEAPRVAVSVYPNPVVDRVTFNLGEENTTEITIEIRDQQNKLIRTLIVPANEMTQSTNFGNLPNGVYYAHIISKKGRTIEKIMKAK